MNRQNIEYVVQASTVAAVVSAGIAMSKIITKEVVAAHPVASRVVAIAASAGMGIAILHGRGVLRRSLADKS